MPLIIRPLHRIVLRHAQADLMAVAEPRELARTIHYSEPSVRRVMGDLRGAGVALPLRRDLILICLSESKRPVYPGQIAIATRLTLDHCTRILRRLGEAGSVEPLGTRISRRWQIKPGVYAKRILLMEWEKDALQELASLQQVLENGWFENSEDFYTALLNVGEAIRLKHGKELGMQRFLSEAGVSGAN